MKVTWGTNSCQRPGNPCYDKKRSGTFGYPRQQQNSHYAWPTISKILEKAVHTQLYAYLKNNGILTSKQFGFRPKLSTGTALAHFTDNILQNMDAGSFTGAVFLDLSKAFDTVDHPLLLQKLTNIGLTTSTTQWFRYLDKSLYILTSSGNVERVASGNSL